MCLEPPFYPVRPQCDLMGAEQLHWSIVGVQGLAQGHLDGDNEGERLLLCHFSLEGSNLESQASLTMLSIISSEPNPDHLVPQTSFQIMKFASSANGSTTVSGQDFHSFVQLKLFHFLNSQKDSKYNFSFF